MQTSLNDISNFLCLCAVNDIALFYMERAKNRRRSYDPTSLSIFGESYILLYRCLHFPSVIILRCFFVLIALLKLLNLSMHVCQLPGFSDVMSISGY